MYLLYLDESGNPDDAADRHFVMGGIAAFERVSFFVSREVNAVQDRYFPDLPPVDFHASHIRAGKGFWRRVQPATRDSVLQDLSQVIARSHDPGARLFAAAVEKTASLHGEDAVKCAIEQVCKRFDTFLARRANEHHDEQRGLLLFAESHYQKHAKMWVRGFRELGTQWGVLRNLSDAPYFAPMQENRLLQLADLVAHATYLLYERRDPRLAKHFVRRFDSKDGVLHGLAHISTDRAGCDCPACASRRAPGQMGSWC